MSAESPRTHPPTRHLRRAGGKIPECVAGDDYWSLSPES
jgi:hypothetical protein